MHKRLIVNDFFESQHFGEGSFQATCFVELYKSCLFVKNWIIEKDRTQNFYPSQEKHVGYVSKRSRAEQPEKGVNHQIILTG